MTWSSNRTDVATVTSSGIVAAVSSGTATITATSEGRNGSATIVVEAPAVNRVEITPATTTVSEGGAFRLTATVYDSRGNVIPGAQVAWTSSDTRVATVDNAGRVVGVRAGSVVITATSSDKAGTANGRMTPETARAIRAFEGDQALAETGRVSGPLISRLARLSGDGRVAAAP